MPTTPDPRLTDLGVSILEQLLLRLGRAPTGFWDWLPEHPDHAWRISRSAAQLIEAASWLECEDEVFRLVERLAEFLTRQPFKQEEVGYSASRLKAILQYYGHESTQPCDATFVTKSLIRINILPHSPQAMSLSDRLCVADLLGFLLSMPKDTAFVQAVLNEALRVQLENKHHLLLEALRRDKAGFEDPSEDPKALSFIIWTLYRGGEYGPPGTPQAFANILPDLRGLAAASEAYDARLGDGRVYRPEELTQHLYPKLILCWHSRKTGQPHVSPRFFDWLASAARHLLETNGDPFHLGLVLKVCTAGANELLRKRLRSKALERAVDALRRESLEGSQEASSLLSRIIGSRLGVSIENQNRLTTGWSSAQVWTVSGRFTFPETGKPAQANGPLSSFSVVVKVGPYDNFTRSAGLFESLREQDKPLFAAHDPVPSSISTNAGPRFFLIMEELQGLASIGKTVLSLAPEDETAAAATGEIGCFVRAGRHGIRRLHEIRDCRALYSQARPRPVQVKVASLFSLLEDVRSKSGRLSLLCRKTATIRALGGEFQCDTTVGDLVSRTFNAVGRIVPAARGAERHLVTHGDCHAHNIMAAIATHGTAERVKFIDIDGLEIEDYLRDYAEYISHLCFSLDLEAAVDECLGVKCEEARGRVVADITMPHARILTIQRSLFRLCFEEAMVEAKERGDKAPDVRLLLLIAFRLFFIASKSRSEAKSAIAFVRGLGVLHRVLAAVRGADGPFAIPATLISLGT